MVMMKGPDGRGSQFLAVEESSIYVVFKKSSVVVVRVPPSLPQRVRLPKGSPL
jgi:hypothetical protein